MAHKPYPPRLPQLLLDELERLPWEFQMGRKHWQLRIDGDLVAIWPRGAPRERFNRNTLSTRASIRRWRNEHERHDQRSA